MSGRRLAALATVTAFATGIMVAAGCTGSGPGATSDSDGSGLPAIASTTSPVVATSIEGSEPATGPMADVVQAVRDYWSASHVCGERPSACDPAGFTAPQGQLRSMVESYRATLIAERSYLAPPDPDDGSFVHIRSALVDPTTNTATTDECVYDAGPLLGPNGPDGQPTVVSDSAAVHHIVHTLYLVDGTWLVGDEQRPDDDDCSEPTNVSTDLSAPTS